MLTPGIVVVTRQTRLQGLRARWVTDEQAKFRLVQAHAIDSASRDTGSKQQTKKSNTSGKRKTAANSAADFSEYQAEDQIYAETLKQLKRDLQFDLPLKFIDRSYLPTFDFYNTAVVVVVGQDGLVANTAKYCQGLPIVGVNPDPTRIDGILVPFKVSDARLVVKRVLQRQAKSHTVTMAEAVLNDGQKMLAFNDFFVGCSGHTSARYTLEVDGRSEAQSSSGILISTGAGSTGWLSSVFNMTQGVAALLGVSTPLGIQLPWHDRRLAWVVREPFRSASSQADLVAGLLPEQREIVVESLMPDNGVIFSDGIESDYLPFSSGTIARIKASDKSATLVAK